MTLAVNQLYKSFGNVKALDGMSFTVNRGELFGFVGSNGAGKTTTMRVMLGVLSPDSGNVTRDGVELDFKARQEFGYMPEERGLYPKMKVLEQLEYLARLHGVEKRTAHEAALYWTERLGVAKRRNDPVQNLSLGNQQRVQLCAALIHSPNFLVLDEPFSGLDPVAVETMSEVLRERTRQGATVLFSSHQLDLVERLCDRVAICSLGKVVSEGTVDELRSTAEVLYDLECSAPREALKSAIGTAQMQVVSETEREIRVALERQDDEQALLRLALEQGAVHRFERYRPHLTELFSSVVVTPVEDDTEAPSAHTKRSLFARRGGK